MVRSRPSQDRGRVLWGLHMFSGWALPRGPVGTLMPLCLNKNRISELLRRRGRPRHRPLRDLRSALGLGQA